MVMSGDVFFSGIKKLCILFFPLWCLQWYEKGPWREDQITFSAFFFCCQLIANVPSSETEFNLYVLSCYEYQNLVIDHSVRQSAADQYLPREAKFCV